MNEWMNEGMCYYSWVRKSFFDRELEKKLPKKKRKYGFSLWISSYIKNERIYEWKVN